MSIVNAKNFTFTYPGAEETTLNDVSLSIKQGEVVGIIGPLGAGKTTLCMAIAGVAPSITGGETSGEINVNSHGSQSSFKDSKDNLVGMVFEEYGAQLIQLKVINEVTEPLLNRGIAKQAALEQARQLLNQVGLNDPDIEDKQIWELSAGQQQRLAIASTLAVEPQVLILDNVLEQLGPYGQEQVKGIITALSNNKTLVLVERKLDFLMQIADRLIVLVDGQVIAEGTPEEILRNHDLLLSADVEPVISLRIARALGLSESPLTPQELERALTIHFRQILKPQSTFEQQELPAAKASFSQPRVCIENLKYRYSDATEALENVNITVHVGELHAVVGPSGAGKTTLIKHIAGLLQPSEGRVTVCDIDTRDQSVPDLALSVGTVLQNPDEQISEKTVKDEIGFPLKQRQYKRTSWFSKYKRYDDNHIEAQVSHACELVGIDSELLDQDPLLLPRGQRKLITIAQALVVEPEVLLLDEPTVGLGAASRHQIGQAIARLCKQGKAVLLVSNNIDFVANIADTVTVLDRGQVVLQGSVQKVFAQANWQQLSSLHLHPPHAAQLAQQLGIHALTGDELVAKLSSIYQQAKLSSLTQEA